MKTYAQAPPNFLERYAIHSKNEHSDETILRDKQTGELVLMKEVLTYSSSDFSKVIQTLESQKELAHEHLLSLLDYQTASDFSVEWGCHHRITTFFQYASHNLLQQIDSRYDEGRLFDEPELWNILTSSVLALAYLQQSAVGHGCVSPVDIFIAADGTVRVVDPSIASSPPYEIQSGYYYAPEILQMDAHTPGDEVFRADVFSLAMCVLHAATLESVDDCFDYENREIDLAAVEAKLELLNGHYSVDLSNLLIEMLNEDPQCRPDFIDLEHRLSEESSLRCSQSRISEQFLTLNRKNTTKLQPTAPMEQLSEETASSQCNIPQIDDTQKVDIPEDQKNNEGTNTIVQLRRSIASERNAEVSNVIASDVSTLSHQQDSTNIQEEIIERIIRVEFTPNTQMSNNYSFSGNDQGSRSSLSNNGSRSSFLRQHPELVPTLQSTPNVQAPSQSSSILNTIHNLSFNRKPDMKELPVFGTPHGKSSVSVYPMSSSSLFTDPALLDMFRQDTNRILSKSQIDKENFNVN